MRKTALLSGVAGLFLMSAPALAHDGTAPQTPPATPPGQAAQAPTLTLQPGMIVRGADGELGTLVGARTNGNRQQLTVQGADGTVRAVPIDGIRQEGDVVVVDFTLEQFSAADTVTAPATPATPGNQQTPDEPDEGEEPDDVDPAATPATPAQPATPAVPGVSPAAPATPAVPATPPAHEEAVTPPPTLPPENPAATPRNPAAPAPGEGADRNPNKPRI